MATLYGVGVGPGDKELLTVKAVRIIEKCDVIVAPSAEEGGESIALETAREYIKPGTEIVIKHFLLLFSMNFIVMIKNMV